MLAPPKLFARPPGKLEAAAQRLSQYLEEQPQMDPPEGFEEGELRSWRRELRKAIGATEITGPIPRPSRATRR